MRGISKISIDSLRNNKNLKKDKYNNEEKVFIEKSTKGRDLYIHVLGKENSKNKIAIIGSIHGDEPQGKYIIEKLMKYLKNNPKEYNNLKILLIPVANPDGLYMNTRVNGNGVDLNRNFPTKDWIEGEKGSRYYSGIAKGSEIETNILIKYINEFNPQLIISIHSPLEVINYDGRGSYKIAKLMKKYSKYKIEGDIGYKTPGSFGTYFGVEGNIPVITLETGFYNKDKVWKDNKKSILAVIKYFNKK